MGNRSIRKTGDTIRKMEKTYEANFNDKAELLRIISDKEGELQLLRQNVHELQGQLQESYIRIKELREELDGNRN